MGTIGTFDAFTSARLGIYAAQHGLRVTGNNISNINTSGYTRQRIDQMSFKSGSNDMYRSMYDNHVGNGALVTGINQVRDPYLDIRYRDTASDVGYYDTTLGGLEQIKAVLDEVNKGSTPENKGDGILYAQLQDLADCLRRLSADPTKDNDTLVRNSAETLCSLFNTYANKLETLRQNTDEAFRKDLTSVNEILTNIRDLNEKIRSSEIHGDNALEMRDERNRQIDALSEYMHIKVEYTMEDVGAGKQVEKLTISLGDSNPDPTVKTDSTVLIDGIYGSTIYFKQEPKANPNYDPTKPADQMYLDENGQPCGRADAAMVEDPHYTIMVSELADSRNIVPKEHELDLNVGRPVELADNDLHGAFQATRELLTEKGEFSTNADVVVDPNAATKRGIPYYQLSLDLLARKFAETYNNLNQGTPVDENGNPITTNTITKEMLVVNDAGQVLDPATGTYTDKGWTLAPDGSGYYVDKDGFLVGNTEHGTCNLDEAHIKYNASQADKDAAAGKYGLSWNEFLLQHGVTGTSTASVTKEVELPEGGVLFSNRNDGDDATNITAANISVSHSWSTAEVEIVPTWTVLFGGDVTHTTQNENVDHMLTKINESLLYNPQDLVGPDCISSKLFEGSFNDMFSNMATTLGNDQRVMNVKLTTGYTAKVELDTSRDGVSGVDLNDEAMNMMQYQKAYSAACRMMTAIDEAIDRLINNTGIAGR